MAMFNVVDSYKYILVLSVTSSLEVARLGTLGHVDVELKNVK